MDRESAILPGYDKMGLNVNHFQLNKFSKPDNGYYQRVKVVIVDMVKNALVLPDNCKDILCEKKIQLSSITTMCMLLRIIKGANSCDSAEANEGSISPGVQTSDSHASV